MEPPDPLKGRKGSRFQVQGFKFQFIGVYHTPPAFQATPSILEGEPQASGDLELETSNLLSELHGLTVNDVDLTLLRSSDLLAVERITGLREGSVRDAGDGGNSRYLAVLNGELSVYVGRSL